MIFTITNLQKTRLTSSNGFEITSRLKIEMAQENQHFMVTVVIPNYNGAKLLRENLPRLILAQKKRKNRINQIIVVDDGSTDGSVELIKRIYPDIKLLTHKQNEGFAKATNRGVRGAGSDLVVLLNTDVVPGENFLAAVFPHFKDKDFFAVSLHEKGYGWAKGRFVGGFVEHEKGGEGYKPRSTFWVSGGSGVFRRSIWNKLGGLDEKLYSPFYWEDLDLSYRALKRGYKLIWEPRANVVHQHETTIKGNFSQNYIDLIQERNQLLFIWKNITSDTLFAQHKRGLVARILKHPGYLKVVAAGLAKLNLVKKAREKERREVKVSDEEILEITRM